jgi:hypothetical protein
MPLPSKIFTYYNACLLADQRGSLLSNVFSKKFEQKFFLGSKEVLLTQEMPWYPLPEAYGQETAAQAQLYQRERDLVYGNFFLTGELADVSKLCAPLVLFPACIEEREDGWQFSLKAEHNALNTQLLQQVVEEESLKKLISLWPPTYQEEDVIKLARSIEKLAPEIDCSALYTYPAIASEKEVKKAYRSGGQLKIIPAAMLALVARNTRGNAVSAELQALADAQNYSKPLQYLFENEPAAEKGQIHLINSVSVLSDAQKQALRNAANYPVSQITGPPGTGKSFTLANSAISQLALKRSVLVVAKTDEAADVLHRMIESLTPELEVAIRAGKNYKTQLKVKFRDMLAGVNHIKAHRRELDVYALEKGLHKINGRLFNAKEKVRSELESHERWGAALTDAEQSGKLLAKLKSWFLFSLNEYGHTPELWEKTKELEELSEQQRKLSIQQIQAEYLEGLITLLELNRKQVSAFYSALRARRSGEQQQHLEAIDFKIALKALPIWVVTARDVAELLPLQANLFDLVLIDEASQMDIATSLPLLQRGRRVAIAGDPMQLRHVSFLSAADQQRFARQLKLSLPAQSLDYANTSLLDLVMYQIQHQEQVVMLDEHFRSHPQIIAFSNKNFYQGKLNIMKERPAGSPETAGGLRFIQVEGKDSNRTNAKELQAILKRITELASQEKDLPAEACSTVGILSPFRNQADFILKEISASPAAQFIQRHSLQVGTPYSFQGEEKDVMYLSLVLDNDSHPTAWRYAATPNVLNVGITRAKHTQEVFYSFNEGINTSLLQQYLKTDLEIKGYDKKSSWQQNQYDEFTQSVAHQLEVHNLPVFVAHRQAGVEVDILIQYKEKLYGIDLIGYPGATAGVLSTSELERLKRIGIAVFPLPYVTWKMNRTACMLELFKFIGRRKPSNLKLGN